MARVKKIEAVPANGADLELAGHELVKCACPGTKPSPEVLVRTNGRCPSCGRGVYVAMHEPSDADESFIILPEPPKVATVAAAVAGVVGADAIAKAILDTATPVSMGQIRNAIPGHPSDVGEIVKVVLPEEMYGMKGTFCSYHCPSIAGETKIREGETRHMAGRRLANELRAVQDEERERSKRAFLAHLPKAFEA